jgi:hypothetical protein
MIDILGFQNLLKDDGTVAAARRLERTLARGRYFLSNSKRPDTDGTPGRGIHGQEFCAFSDTVLAWTPPIPAGVIVDEKSSALDDIECFFGWLAYVLYYAFQFGLPMRAGVAFGQCSTIKDSNVMLGTPIVDAHNLEAAQKWVGCALHPSCIGERSPIQDARLLSPYVLGYDRIPFADGRLERGYVVDWVAPVCHLYRGLPGIDYRRTVNRVRKQLKRYLRKYSDPDIKLKYRNARDFYAHYRSLNDSTFKIDQADMWWEDEENEWDSCGLPLSPTAG